MATVPGTEFPVLSPAFRPPAYFHGAEYQLLPFRFLRLEERGRYLLTNLVGEYLLVDRNELVALTRHQLDPQSALYHDLKGKHFLHDGVSDVALELLAAKYRTRQSALPSLTGLHLFVVTLRCDHSCPYCQVSRVSTDRVAYDMDEGTAERAIRLMFRSPSPALKVEFQGGEALLNFERVRQIVERTRELNDGRELQFVIATNLSPLTDEILAFCRDHQVFISTSLDGPAALHNANGPVPGGDSYQRTIRGIERVRAALGPDSVSALMTTTARSLTQPREIVDEYVQQGFRSLFLRPISPYGFALRSAARIGYEVEDFLRFYREALLYILELNRQGIAFREDYAAINLRKILTPYPSSYVDLQSPAGAGIGALVYNYDGDVYASDEGRMLAETGDTTFRLGNVHRNSWEELFLDSSLLPLLHDTMSEGTPGCCDCAFQPWCGTDPVFHHATQGDAVGHRPTSEFCQKNMAIFRLLLELLEDDPEARKVFRRWAQ